MHNYRNLEVWRAAVQLANDTYEVTEQFPANERFELVKQMRRSSVSIGSNIAEGSSRRTAKDFRRFLEIAQGSTFELATQLYIANLRGFVPHSDFARLDATIQSVSSMLAGLKQAATDQR